ncbi:gas vesicle protein GvpJ [Lentzea aerocolonigenes]|uniref:gas vesicle protein GvpJ n=1 Tax=Lentzea aerocolonigenes TaxID=68170 RepID=UPI0004C36DC7|nr:gas vesicle protein GvpJ [Lentzea aerocolonigenes]MCP2246125.1 Gas vesicle protein [Lentzea aerocolonigenes]
MTAPAVPGSGGLADVLNVLLDKGLVIDASVKVSLIGIEILSIDIKVVIASVDTYIRYLEAMQRLEVARRGVVVQPPGGQGIAGTYGLLTQAAVPAVVAPAVVTPAPAVTPAPVAVEEPQP